MRHNIEYFLQINESLKPSDSALGPAVTSSDWWGFIGPLWDDLLWMYYGDRVLFFNKRFPDDDDEKCVDNLLRVWSTYLKSKAHNFDRIYNVLWQEYNPLWNVDGVTGTISEDSHTGTDTRSKTGDDTLKMTGTDTHSLSGEDSTTSSGTDGVKMGGTDSVDVSVTKDDTTRSGNEVLAASGNDVNSKQVATFDSNDNFVNQERNTITNGKTDTHTYNNVKDAHELESGTDTTYGKTIDTTYGKVSTAEYGKVDTNQRDMQDKTEYNSTDTNTKNLQDKHVDLVIRQGNIGVTMSQQLLQAELEARQYDFAKMIIKECVNLVTYAVEGV